MAFAPYYQNYQTPYYQPPMQDQLSQLRQQQYQPPVAQQPPAPTPQQTSTGGIVWCQGEEGAKGFLVAAGNSVLLMDSENSTFYIKSTDVSGMPQPLRIFDYKERTAPVKSPTAGTSDPGVEFVTREEFEALAARIDEMATKRAVNSKKEETKDA